MFLKKIDLALNDVLESYGLEKAFPLQKKVIGKLKQGADMVCIAPKGSGKSTSLVVGLIQVLKEAVDDVPRAIIIVEDTDVAIALKEKFDEYGKCTNLRVNLVTKKGKIDAVRDQVYLGSDIVIGIPSRLDELYSLNGINITGLRYLILDEAQEYMKFQALSQVYRLSESAFKAQHFLLAEHVNEGIERFIEKRMKIQEIDEFNSEE